ncbi:MAG: Hpt domain-containing protein [Pseudomonadota bacterium]
MIDWRRVKALRDEVGAEDFEEVVELFMEEVDEVVDRLRAGTSPASLEEDMHFLKGSAVSLGFSDFATLCEAAEVAARAGNAASIDLNAVLSAYTASRTVFLTERAAQMAA